MWHYHTTARGFELIYNMEKQPESDATQNFLNSLYIKKTQAEIKLIETQIITNSSMAFNQTNSVYLGLLAELRSLALAFEIDVEKTILESEPKYKPLYSGERKDKLVDDIDKIIMKLKSNLDIK